MCCKWFLVIKMRIPPQGASQGASQGAFHVLMFVIFLAEALDQIGPNFQRLQYGCDAGDFFLRGNAP